MKKYQLIVVGGGAAGLMAAGEAAKLGVSTLLFEKKTQPGRKLRITGKGRCNLSNTAKLSDFIACFGKNGRFLRQAFNKYFSDDLIEFFESLGVKTNFERGGRIFPASEDAQEVVDALVKWVNKQGVVVKKDASVDELLIKDNRVQGVRVGQQKYYADAVLVATGGKSYPATGSTGDGYKLAKAAGHTVIPVRPALVPVETSGNLAKRLQGLSLRNVKVRMFVDGKKTDEAFGEMLFAHFGLTGPIILTLSGNIVDALRDKKKVILSIDLKAALDDVKLDRRLLSDLQENSKKQFHTVLKGLLPSKMIPVCCDLTKIPEDKIGHQITAEDRKRLRLWLKDFQFEVVRHRPFEEAIVTAGGVSTKEINPRTMESNIVKGLYFAGEVIDIDGDTGGYNLQAAFSTGWLAAHNLSPAPQ